MTARFRVAHAGPLCSWQDDGRPGLMRYGIPRSGPMDRLAFAAAHAALGQGAGPVIEISPGGLVLDFLEGEASLALTGGDFDARLGPARLEMPVVAGIAAGQRLAIRAGPSGNWACLAFAGAPVVPRWLGSAATHTPSGLGGGMIRAGAVIEIAGAERRPGREGPIPLPRPAAPQPIRILPGPQEEHFAAGALGALAGAEFTPAGRFDRMGLRLDGPLLALRGPLDMPSGPVPRGAVQVSGEGVATVLMADHQTTGGYPRIATVIDCDLDRLAQWPKGRPLRFAAVSPEEAVALARAAAADRALIVALATPRASLAERLASLNLTGGVVSARDG